MTKSADKPQLPRRLAAASIPAEVDPLDAFLAEPSASEMMAKAANSRVTTLLAMAMLQDAMRPADLRRISKAAGLAVVIGVPGPDWVDPVARALDRVGLWGDFLKRSGGSRTQDRPDVGCDAVAEALGAGQNVAGVSNAPERYLPSNLMALADIRVDLKSPSPRALRSTIRLATGSRPGTIKPGIAAGLPFATVAGCIRRGSSGRACVRRIENASRALSSPPQGLDDVPFLKDCHGYGDEVMRWGQGLVSAMAEVRAGTRLMTSVEDRHIVLGGEAGVGKTVFARILAKSLGVPLHATSVSAWFASTGGYLNEVVKQVDMVFGQAVASGPAVLLLDEIDALPNRATVDNRHRDYWVPIVSHILTALDSAVSGASSSLIVIGTTNFPERLDEALVRPGRLNRVVRIERPDVPAIAGILRHHLGDDLQDVDLSAIASVGAGSTGAEVAGWAKRARGHARAAGRPMIRADLVSQVAPAETRDPAEVLAIARHEAGHCVIGQLVGSTRVETVSTVATGPYAGVTRSRVCVRSSVTRRALDDYVTTLLAGRAADALWGSVHSGSAGQPGSDLAAATRLVAAAHASYGLGGSLVWLGSEEEAMQMVRLDPSFRRQVQSDLAELQSRADALVAEHADTIDAVAQRLVKQRVMSGDEVRHVIATRHAGAPTPEPGETRNA